MQTTAQGKPTYPLDDSVPFKNKIAVGITPCLMFILTGIIGYGTGNVLPQVVENANAMALYGMVALLITVVNTISSPLAGSLGDIFGRKRVVMACLIPFSLSVALIGLATNAVVLCIAIFVMSFAFSICQGSTTAMISDAVSGKTMSTLMGVRHSAGQVALLVGPIIVGALATAFGARTTYIVLAPLGIVALLLVAFLTPNVRFHKGSSKVDIKGAFLLLVAMGGISLFLSMGGSNFAWVSLPSVILVALAVVGAALFIRAEKTAANPMIDLSILKYKEMPPILWYKGLMQTSSSVFGAYLILYCQTIIGMTAATTGLFGLSRIASIIGSTYVGAWIARKKCVTLSAHIGTGLSFAATLIVMFIRPTTPFALIMVAQVMLALTASFGTIPLTLIPPVVLPKEKVGNGLGVFWFSENLGSVEGTATAAVIINTIGGGEVLNCFRFIAGAYLLFTLIRLVLTIKQFPTLKEAVAKL